MARRDSLRGGAGRLPFRHAIRYGITVGIVVAGTVGIPLGCILFAARSLGERTGAYSGGLVPSPVAGLCFGIVVGLGATALAYRVSRRGGVGGSGRSVEAPYSGPARRWAPGSDGHGLPAGAPPAKVTT